MSIIYKYKNIKLKSSKIKKNETKDKVTFRRNCYI